MSIWKSPVFYFGVLLVVALTAALSAPWWVDWNNYKTDLQRYGRKLTGREVVIAGPIDVRLFPWPRLVAGKVSIANQQGFGNAPLLTAEKINLNLSLAGLFGGIVDVQKVEVENPHINLQRLADGSVNWLLSSDEALNGLLSRVNLAEIDIRNASVFLEDKSRQLSTNFSKANAVLNAQNFEGPWRVRGSGNWAETPVTFTFNSTAYEANQPFRFGARMSPDDSTLPAFTLEGEWLAQVLKGKLRLDAQADVAADGSLKGSTEGSFRPLALQAEMELSLDRVSFDKIRIAPADTKDSGTLIEGYSLLTFGEKPAAQLLLKSPRVNLDTLVGADTLTRWRNGGMLAIANSLLANLPETLVTDYSIAVNVLTSGGETLNDVRIKGVADKQAIRIYDATASLPGRSRMKFDGTIFPAPETAELGGTLAFESNDLRDFTGWLLPASRKSFESVWNGSRGTLKLQSKLNWSGLRLAFKELDYEFEGQPGKADVAIRLGDFPALDLILSIKSLDLDNLMTSGVSLAGGDAAMSLFSLMPNLLADGQNNERRVNLKIDSLALNGATANDIIFDFASSLSGFEIKTLKVGSINGATINGSGLVLQDGNGPSGELNLNLAAQNATGLLQMAGLSRDGKFPGAIAIGNILGPLKASMTFAVVPGANGPSINFKSNGQSSTITFTATGTAKGLERAETTWVELNSVLDAKDATSLTRLVELEPVLPDGKSGKAVLKTAGSRSEGYDSSLDFSGFESQIAVKGHHEIGAVFGDVKGNTEVSSPNATALLAAIGLPFSPDRPLPLKISGKLSVADSLLKLSEIQGTLDGQKINGEATIAASGELNADLESESLHLRDILSAAFLPWNGPRPDFGDNFANPADTRLNGTLFLRPKQLLTGLGKPQLETVLGIEFKPDQRSITLKQPGSEGMDLDILLKPRGSTFDVRGKGRLGFDFASTMALADNTPLAAGQGLLSGEFKSQGRSPYAVLSAMEGKGVYQLRDASLQQFTLQNFATAINTVKTSQALSQILAALESGPGTLIGAHTGEIAIAAGLAKLAPLSAIIDGSSLTLDATIDLPETILSTVAKLTVIARPELPPVTLSYSGKPGRLEKRSGTAALAAKLGYDLLAKEMADLEKLQKQQAELVAKEDQQRRDDEERFAAYQAQRAELRQRQRELRIHADERSRLDTVFKTALSEALKSGDALNKLDLAKRKRQAEVRKILKVLP